jgi:hypothetical protein
MSKILVCAGIVAILIVPASAEETPGVTQIAPGVQQVDGAKVPSQTVDMAALEALIKDKKSLRAVKGVLHGDGVTSVGPAGTTAHMYKVHDTASGKDLVLILFVDGDKIVDHLAV